MDHLVKVQIGCGGICALVRMMTGGGGVDVWEVKIRSGDTKYKNLPADT